MHRLCGCPGEAGRRLSQLGRAGNPHVLGRRPSGAALAAYLISGRRPPGRAALGPYVETVGRRHLGLGDLALPRLPGPAGPKGDAGATHLVVRTTSGHGIQRTDCGPGEVATGGGAHSPDGYVIASIPASHLQAPFAQNGPPTQYPAPTSWEARAVKVNVSGTGAITSVDDADLTTWVVCAAP
jgi:hypothetical protein